MPDFTFALKEPKTPNAPLRILIDARYVQDHFPGIGRYTYALIEGLAGLPNGPRLTLLYNPALPDSRYGLPALAARFPDRLELLPTTVRPFSSGEQWRLFGPARRGNYGLWHAPYYVRPYLLPLPSVLTAYDVISARLPGLALQGKARLAFELTTRLALRASRRIIAISQSSANDLQEFYGVPERKIRVVPLGVGAAFRPLDPDEQATARAELGLPERYLLYVGINKPHKNLARLLAAFKRYSDRTGDPILLILAGKEDPRYSAALRDTAHSLQLSHQVDFRGEIAEADLPRLYACASLFVFPSLQEGFGLPVLEAMGCGAAVACADNSALPEVAGGAAVLFRAEDVEAQASAIAQGLHQAAELREKGLARARLFSWQRTAERTYEVYLETSRNA